MQRPIRTVSLTSLLIAFGLGLAGAPALAEPPMVFQHLSSQQGLPQNTVMQTLQDSQGFIWIATEDGLVRYDGNEMRRYANDRDRGDSLAGNFVWSIAEDRGGDLWIALKDAGLARWNRRTDRFTSFRHDPARRSGLSSDELRTLIIDRHGHIWIGTTGGGLEEFNPATSLFRHYTHEAARADSLSSDVVTSLWEAADGEIWVGTDDGLNRLIPATGTFRRYRAAALDPRSLSSSRIAAIRTDQRGRLWVGTFDGGLNLFDRKAETFTAYRHRANQSGSLASDEVRAILEDHQGRLWVGTAGGLNLREERTDRFSRYLHDPADSTTLPDDYVMSLFEDRAGLLWVGTRAGGVSCWNSRTWSFGHWRPTAFGGAYVQSFAEDPGGHLWIGTFGQGLVRFDPASGAYVRLDDIAGQRQRLTDPRVMSLVMDRSGDLWIGTMSGGLSRLSAAGRLDTWAFDAATSDAHGANGIMALLAHSNGRIWLGTFGAGVMILDPASGRFQRVAYDPRDPHSLSGPRATALAEDRDGNVWVGTEGGGLDLLRRDGSVAAVFQHRPGDPASLSAKTIYALHIDQNGRVWVGTGGGGLDLVLGSAAHPQSIQFKNVSQRDGLTSDFIYGIQSDDLGAIWLSGNAGLVRYDPANGEARPFHREHGLQGEEFNFGAHYRTRAGMLVFGGPNGFNLFDPARVLERAATPNVALTNVEVLNKPAATTMPYPLLDRLDLGYRDTALRFEFAALDFAAPDRNLYAYRLRGFETDWVNLRNRHSVSYTNLNAGSYVLEVKAATSDGVWGPVSLRLPIVVATAPWRTWWAFAIYAGACLLLMYGWHRKHLRRLSEAADAGHRLEAQVAERTAELRDRNAELDRVNSVKSEFLARMSHEIRSPMNGVIGTLELLHRTPQTTRQAKLTKTARTSAHSLLRILNDILDLAKVEAGKLTLELAPFDLCALIDDTAQLFTPQAEAKRLELIVSMAPELHRHLVGDALRVQQMLTNLIGNAVKFTEKGEVVVAVTVSDSTTTDTEVTITIRDTGIGMPAAVLAKVFEPFTQADESTTRRFGGTGLGLAICRELASLMGASINAQSEPGRGSIFTLRLRLPCGDPVVNPYAGQFAGLRGLIACPRTALVNAIARDAQNWGLRIDVLAPDEDLVEYLAAAAGDANAARGGVVILDADSFAAQLTSILPGESDSHRPTIVYLCSADPQVRAHLETVDAQLRVVGKPVRRTELFDALCRAFGRQPSATSARPRSSRAESFQAHVLVAEDNLVNQTVTEGYLRDIGCSVVCVPDGRAAVGRATSGAFDLILMDLQMPDIDGVTATAMIRQAESVGGGRRTPIIAVTANASATHREACLLAGMDDFLGKPLGYEELRDVLQHWIPEYGRAIELRPPHDPIDSCEAAHQALDASMIAGIRAVSRRGQTNLFLRLVDAFSTSSRRQLDELRAALSRGDLPAAAAACHTLKGGAGSIGAKALAAVAREIEIECIAGNSPAVNRLTLELDRLHPIAMSALQEEMLKETA